MNLIEISDLSRPELQPYARLTEAQLRSPRTGLFIAESVRVIRCALEKGLEPVSMLMERRHVNGSAAELIARIGDIPVYTGEREILAALAGYTLTRGVLCAMKRPEPRPYPELIEHARRIAVLEGLIDPTNVGAIFRSAAALGADAVLLSPDCCDPLHRRAVRVGMGTMFQVPWARISPWPQAIEALKARGFSVCALALRPDSTPVDDPELAVCERLAILLGAEGDGLREETLAACDRTAIIPMRHGVDSLNVAAASAVAFYELCR